MPTGRTLFASVPARAALAGNPSDGYGGCVVAVPVAGLAAVAAFEPAGITEVQVDDQNLRRLLTATLDEFEEVAGTRPAGTLSATTTIPRSVGLAGSSALIIAALQVLARATEFVWETMDLAHVALRTETNRLGVAAGLQDRLVQSVSAPVVMEFDPPSFRTTNLPDWEWFVAWSTRGAASSGLLHRSLRRRHESDPTVAAGMRSIAEQARRLATALEHADRDEAARAIDTGFDRRRDVVTVDDTTLELADIARSAGAAANTAGSGGSIVGLAPTTLALDRIAHAVQRAGGQFRRLFDEDASFQKSNGQDRH